MAEHVLGNVGVSSDSLLSECRDLAVAVIFRISIHQWVLFAPAIERLSCPEEFAEQSLMRRVVLLLAIWRTVIDYLAVPARNEAWFFAKVADHEDVLSVQRGNFMRYLTLAIESIRFCSIL